MIVVAVVRVGGVQLMFFVVLAVGICDYSAGVDGRW